MNSQTYFEKRQKEIAESNKLLKSKLMEITLHYTNTKNSINYLKSKIKDSKFLELLGEIDKNTVATHDLYGMVLEFIIDSNQREFKIMLDIIDNAQKKKE